MRWCSMRARPLSAESRRRSALTPWSSPVASLRLPKCWWLGKPYCRTASMCTRTLSLRASRKRWSSSGTQRLADSRLHRRAHQNRRKPRAWVLLAIRECAIRPPENVVAAGNRSVFGRLARLHHRFDYGIEIRVGEHRDRQALTPGTVDHAMRIGFEALVGPAPQEVAGIDHQGAGNRLRGDPFALARGHLQAADLGPGAAR